MENSIYLFMRKKKLIIFYNIIGTFMKIL